ncbi:hypothetical protein LX99_00119 [Mucilaginibacter oryzae]|uniref:Uncharacterized protein n=1 Tax=Mucilaginibacter oryzae TaxID=468058 RepID=A0A316HHZ0_9SPHI|nr:hypothetical protein [Mucilaginibacter oryzae]PWK79661.1 hypothetical protein LX99_00119 [Mucilaginibacter oryzae]
MSILITAATSAQAYQLKSKLQGQDIILGDHLDLPEFMVKTGKMIVLPKPASASYTHEMLTLCLDKNITQVYLLRPEEIELLLKAETLFNEYNITLQVIA